MTKPINPLNVAVLRHRTKTDVVLKLVQGNDNILYVFGLNDVGEFQLLPSGVTSYETRDAATAGFLSHVEVALRDYSLVTPYRFSN